MSGRREASVHGGRPADRVELLHLRGRLRRRDRRRDDRCWSATLEPDPGRHPRRDDGRPGHPGRCSSSTSRAGSSGTAPGTASASSRCSSAARSTSTRRIGCSRSDGHDRPAPDRQRRDLRARWTGSRGRRTPTTCFPRRRARRTPSPSTCGRAATTPDRVHRDRRLGRGPRGRRGGRPLLRRSPTARSAIPALREAIAGRPNVTVTEGRMGDGVYEAVVSTLAGA